MPLEYSTALVTLATSDLESLVQFYSQIFGVEARVYTADVYAEFQLPGLRLGIFRPRAADITEFQQSGKSQMSLCFEVSDLAAAIAHLDALGYPPPGEVITASHGQEIYVYDPAGNRLILYSRQHF